MTKKKRHLYICSGRTDRNHCNSSCDCGVPHFPDECTGEEWCAVVKDFVRCKRVGARLTAKFEGAMNVKFD